VVGGRVGVVGGRVGVIGGEVCVVGGEVCIVGGEVCIVGEMVGIVGCVDGIASLLPSITITRFFSFSDFGNIDRCVFKPLEWRRWTWGGYRRLGDNFLNILKIFVTFHTNCWSAHRSLALLLIFFCSSSILPCRVGTFLKLASLLPNIRAPEPGTVQTVTTITTGVANTWFTLLASY